MLNYVKKLFSKSQALNIAMGDVVYETEMISGQTSHGFVSFRIKKQLDETGYLLGCKFKPDMYAGPDGSPTNYIYFDIEGAIRLRDTLDNCIDRYTSIAERQK